MSLSWCHMMVHERKLFRSTRTCSMTQRLRVEEFAARLSALDLRTVFARGDRYDLDGVGRQEETHRTPARSGPPASTQAHVPASLMR